MTKLIFGCGYLGMRVARRWLEAGQEVIGVTRSPRRMAELEQLGIRPLVADVTRPIALPPLPPLSSVLFAVGFDRSAGKSIQEVYVGGLRNALQALPDSIGRLLYVSSTGVYGQSDGQWVDEDSPCEPARAGGQACLSAERLLAAHFLGRRAVVLRLAGIYGPGRIPKSEAVRAGLPVAAEHRGYLNLIHVADAARAVLAAEEKAVPPCRYVVADGEPVTRGDFYRELARLVAAPSPRFVGPPENSTTEQRALGSKRVCSARMKRDLGISLTYPSFREGLAAIISQEGASREEA